LVVDLSGGMVQIAAVDCEWGINQGQEGAVYVLCCFVSLGCFLGEGWWRWPTITEMEMLFDMGGEGVDGVWGRVAGWWSNWLCFALVFVVLT
jgi:hypothetical protein